jgi:hypothetical protein
MDEANLEPETSCSGASIAAEAARAEAAAAQEQLFWMDASLPPVELIWGLLCCAAALPAVALAAVPQEQPSHLDLLSRVQALLEGPHGLFEALLGVQCLVASHDTGANIDEAAVLDQQQPEQHAAEEGQEQHEKEAGDCVAPEHEVADGDDGGSAAADVVAAAFSD